MDNNKMSAVQAILEAGQRGVIIPSTNESTEDQGTTNQQTKSDEQEQED